MDFSSDSVVGAVAAPNSGSLLADDVVELSLFRAVQECLPLQSRVEQNRTPGMLRIPNRDHACCGRDLDAAGAATLPRRPPGQAGEFGPCECHGSSSVVSATDGVVHSWGGSSGSGCYDGSIAEVVGDAGKPGNGTGWAVGDRSEVVERVAVACNVFVAIEVEAASHSLNIDDV